MDIQPKDTSKAHFYISLVKSAIRVAAGGALAMAGYDPALISAWLKLSAGLFILAECLGVAEELF